MTLVADSTALALGNASEWPLKKRTEKNKRANNNNINNGNRSPIWTVIIRVINKSNDREAGVRFVNYEYDCKQVDDKKSCYQLITTMTEFEKETRHWFYTFSFKINSAKCETTARAHDAFCPLT